MSSAEEVFAENTRVTVTGRGFKHFTINPQSDYGGEAKVYESSAVEPHIWLSVECPENLNDPEGNTIEAVAHLDLDEATRLRDQLTFLLDNHFLVR